MYMGRDLRLAKQDVEKYKGCVVTVRSNAGRQRIKKFEGVIKDAYPSVFTIMLQGESVCNIKTFSYVDLLTNNVELTLKN